MDTSKPTPDLTGIQQVLSRATGTGWEAAYRQDVGALLGEITRLRAEAAAGGEREAGDDLPRHLRLALANAARAFERGELGALATINENVQPLVDAAIGWHRRQDAGLRGLWQGQRETIGRLQEDLDAALRRAEAAEGARDALTAEHKGNLDFFRGALHLVGEKIVAGDYGGARDDAGAAAWIGMLGVDRKAAAEALKRAHARWDANADAVKRGLRVTPTAKEGIK